MNLILLYQEHMVAGFRNKKKKIKTPERALIEVQNSFLFKSRTECKYPHKADYNQPFTHIRDRIVSNVSFRALLSPTT